MKLRFAIALMACLAVVCAYAKGRTDGRTLERAGQIEATAALQARVDDATENLARMNAALRAARAARALNAMEIEDEARADPAAVDRLPSPDSLRRLRARWGAPAAP
jgi:hypothetical protein